MSWLKRNVHLKCSFFVPLLLAIATLLLPGLNATAAADFVTLDDERSLLAAPLYDPVVQVTTDPGGEYSSALAYTADQKLLTVFGRNGELWSRASTDGGATWAAETPVAGCCRNNPSLARAADGTLWLAYGRDGTIWYRTSADHGATWLTESQIPPDGRDDADPVIFQAVDGKLWVVWRAYRLYEIGGGVIVEEVGLWYKTSTDSGATWSAETRLTTGSDFAPAAAVTSAGRVIVVWQRGNGELWQRRSSDGGVTWSTETRIAGCCRRKPSMASVGGVLWLAYENDGNILYRTSANQGTSWSTEESFTRFVGPDDDVTVASLASGKPALVWSSVRSSNPDIWFGIPGEHDDVNPPPHVEWIEYRPQCNLDSTTPITFRARALDETDMARVELVWTLDGGVQSDIPMFDDGAHNDDVAGDGVWGVEHEPLLPNSQVIYSARATDTDGNSYLSGQNGFTVQPHFAKTSDFLFVPDVGGYETAWFSSYYTQALDALNYDYDTWDTRLRCAPDSAILSQYTAGAIIWAVPYWKSYITDDGDLRTAVQSYLDAGGKLFISGQMVAYFTRETSFLEEYLHANYLQVMDSTFRTVRGVAGSLVGDGLTLGIAGGDGANNQDYPNEIAPITPAEADFTYQAGGSAMLAESTLPPEKASTPVDPNRALPPDIQAELDASAIVTPGDATSSGTAAVSVDTGAYKTVFFAFGFEAINSAARRTEVMGRVLGWLTGRLVRLTPADEQKVPPGDVTFSWADVGAHSYRIQIDTVSTFDSPDLIDKEVDGTSYSHSFTNLDIWYWRALALPDGEWTSIWSFSVAADVVPVTTDPADDTAPALAQTGDGNLLTVFVRNGNLWSRASADSGATWGAEKQVAGCCRYNPNLARAEDGTLWLAYDRDGDIWYRTSIDHGVTWAAEKRLATDEASDSDPVVFQAADGKLWVVWQSSRSYYYPSIWYKTSANGVTWSADTRLTNDAYDFAPAATSASDGQLVVIWNRWSGELWQRSSSDGGATWSTEKRISDCCRNRPSLATVGGKLWLVYESNKEIWHRISGDNGDTWLDETRFTRFVGPDYAPGAAALASGRVGIAWQSERSGNPDIWFGSPGEREDLNPPPYIESIEHQPAPNPDSESPITFRAVAWDEMGVASVRVAWTLNGAAQDDLVMCLGCPFTGAPIPAGIWGVQHAALPVGSQVVYTVVATDTDGNTYRYPGQRSFTVLPPFIKMADILFVPDAGGNNTPADTAWFRSYYTNALDALGYRYDIWDTEFRGAPGTALLSRYTRGAVIWAVPYWGYITAYGSDGTDALKRYLDAGGKLFITGQNIADSLSWGNGAGFLNDYLRATYRQSDTGLYALSGASADPIGDGLSLNISGGDGANDQYSKDEMDPIVPAEVVFTYRSGASAMLAEPIRPSGETPVDPQNTGRQPSADGPEALPQPGASATPAANVPTAPEGNVGSGTAGLRVDTGKYKVVYFAFGFEAINRAADRQAVMARVLNWLALGQPPKLYLPLVFAQPSAATAFWADRYVLGPGECTTLHWSVADAQAVYLNGMGVPAQGSQAVCPAETHGYILRVERANFTVEYLVTISVDFGG